MLLAASTPSLSGCSSGCERIKNDDSHKMRLSRETPVDCRRCLSKNECVSGDCLSTERTSRTLWILPRDLCRLCLGEVSLDVTITGRFRLLRVSLWLKRGFLFGDRYTTAAAEGNASKGRWGNTHGGRALLRAHVANTARVRKSSFSGALEMTL
ncbi:hypothetical protein MRX96_009675 [Rhipicephalus microplus]